MNKSANEDLPVVELKKGSVYRFSNGEVMGRGQKYVSQWELAKIITVEK